MDEQPSTRRYTVAIEGFSEFERGALAYCFRLTAERQPAFEPVAGHRQADFVVADADHASVVASLVEEGRIDDTVFVGGVPPGGAMSHVARPIDPTLIVRELDAFVSRREATAADDIPTITLPLQADEALVFPPLEVDVPPEAPARTPEAKRTPEPEPELQLEHQLEPAAEQESTVESVPAPAPNPEEERERLARRAEAKAAARAAAERARQRDAGIPTATAAAAGDVLVLDDSGVAQRFLCHLLESLGFRAHAVSNSRHALELLRQRRFAAVFIDIILGENDPTDGLGLCQQVKRSAVADAPPPVVVLVSGQGRPSDRVRAQLAGSDAFLVKPVTQIELSRTLEHCGVALPVSGAHRP